MGGRGNTNEETGSHRGGNALDRERDLLRITILRHSLAQERSNGG